MFKMIIFTFKMILIIKIRKLMILQKFFKLREKKL